MVADKNGSGSNFVRRKFDLTRTNLKETLFEQEKTRFIGNEKLSAPSSHRLNYCYHSVCLRCNFNVVTNVFAQWNGVFIVQHQHARVHSLILTWSSMCIINQCAVRYIIFFLVAPGLCKTSYLKQPKHISAKLRTVFSWHVSQRHVNL